MMTFAQIRSLAGYDTEQADEEAHLARPAVRIAGTAETAVLIGVDGDGTAVVERDGWPAYWIVFKHLQDPA